MTKQYGLILILLGILFFAHWSIQPKRESLWKKELHQKHKVPLTLQEKNFSPLLDFFNFNDFNKTIGYNIKVESQSSLLALETKRNSELSKELFKYAFWEAFQELRPGLPQIFPQIWHVLLNSEFKSVFFKHFTSSLAQEGISGGTFQYDLDFSPYRIRGVKFRNSLEHIISYESLPLKAQLSSLDEKKTFILPKQLHSSYQYTGGLITLWFKVLDIPSQKRVLASPQTHEWIKGFLRLRRFFRLQLPRNNALPVNGKQAVQLQRILVKPQSPSNDFVVTVDTFYTFQKNQSGFKPSHLEINFGQKLKSYFHKSDYVSHLLSDHSSSESTGSVFIIGNALNHNKQVRFKTQISKLIYDINENEFTSDSLLTTDIFSKDPFQRSNFKFKINDLILTHFSPLLIKKLALDRFHYFPITRLPSSQIQEVK